jgi:hypothetical protein
MKILMIDCTAEELRANRTVMDSITDAISGFAHNLAGVNLSQDDIIRVLNNMSDEEEESEEEG